MPRKLKSEYDAEFHGKMDVDDYRGHVNYRLSRRYNECKHTPLQWYNESSDENLTKQSRDFSKKGSKNTKEMAENKTKSKPIAYSDDEEYFSSSASDSSETEEFPQKIQKRNGSKKPTRPEVSSKIKEDDIARLKALAVEQAEILTARESQQHEDDEVDGGRMFRRPRNPKTRPMSANYTKHDLKQSSKSHPKDAAAPSTHQRPEKKIFISYGHADQEPVAGVGVKRTFNVRSKNDVYFTALRAREQRQLELQQQKLKKRQQQDEAVRKSQELLDMARRGQDPHQHALNPLFYSSSEWRSEYQQRFPAYDNAFYEKAAHLRTSEHVRPVEPLEPETFLQCVSPRNYLPQRHHKHAASKTHPSHTVAAVR